MATVPERVIKLKDIVAGSDAATALLNAIQVALAGVKSAGGRLWWNELFVQASPKQILYYSKGDPDILSGVGDTRIFARFNVATTTTITMLSYTDGDNTGANTHSRSLTLTLPSATEDILECDIMINEYAMSFYIRQASGSEYGSVGQSSRTHIPKAHRFRGFLSQPVSSGSTVRIFVDRNPVGQVQVGESIDLITMTPIGSPLVTHVHERTTVIAVGPGYIDANLSNGFAAGTIIGLDPVPNYVANETLFFFVTNMDISAVSYNCSALVATNFLHATHDPHKFGWSMGSRVLISQGTDGNRGIAYCMLVTANVAGITRNHRVRDNFDPEKYYRPYPDINPISSGFIYCFGPYGAPNDLYKNAKSLLLGGTDEYVLVSHQASLTPLEPTVSGWFKLDTLADNQVIISSWDDGTNTNYVIRNGSGANNARLELVAALSTTDTYAAAGNINRTDTDVLVADQWHHIALVMESGNLTIYVDGVSIAFTEIPGSSYAGDDYDHAAPVEIGGNSSLGLYTVGNFKDWSIFDDVFSASDVSELRLGGLPSNLVNHPKFANASMWLRLGDGVNDAHPNYADLSAASNDGVSENTEAADIELDSPQ